MNRSRRNFGVRGVASRFAGFVAGGAPGRFSRVAAARRDRGHMSDRKGCKSGEQARYVVQIRKAVAATQAFAAAEMGVINGDGREVRSGIMVIPIDMQQLSSVAWGFFGPHRGRVGETLLKRSIPASCSMQKGFLPHQTHGCCPRNDAMRVERRVPGYTRIKLEVRVKMVVSILGT